MRKNVILAPRIFNNMLFSLGNEISLKVTEFFYTDEEITGYRQKEYVKKSEIIVAIKSFLNNTDTMKNTFGPFYLNKFKSKLDDYFNKYNQMMEGTFNLNEFNNYFINFYYLYLWINYLRCIKFKQKTATTIDFSKIKIVDKLKDSIVNYFQNRESYKHGIYTFIVVRI